MPPRPRTPTDLAVAGALARTAPAVTRWIERVLARHDPPLTLAQYLLLQEVADGVTGGSELARRASVSPAAVSQLLATLETANHLERARTVDDRRRHELSLTPSGRRILESATTSVQRRLSALLSGMPKPELDALARLLRRLDEPFAAAPPRRPERPRPPRPRPRR